MKKAVAIPYIVAILFGVVVIGLIGYWIFKTVSQGTGSGDLADCQTKELNYCSSWSNSGFDESRRPSSVFGGWDSKKCNSVLGISGDDPPSEPTCRSILSRLIVTGGICTDDKQCATGTCNSRPTCERGTPDATTKLCPDGSEPARRCK
jgi:hypothetical protein